MSRNFKTLSVQTLQYVILLPKKLRPNISFLFVFQTDSKQEVDTYYKMYGGAFTSANLMRKALMKATEEKGCFVFDRTSTSANPEERYFYWRSGSAQDPEFVVGTPWSQKQYRDMYDPDWEQRHNLELEQTKEKTTQKYGKKTGTSRKKKTEHIKPHEFTEVELVPM